MILIDANLLLYAYDSNRQKAVGGPFSQGWNRREYLEYNFGFPEDCENPRAMEYPLAVSEAAGIVAEWISLPMVQLVGPTDRHWDILNALLTQARGPLMMHAERHSPSHCLMPVHQRPRLQPFSRFAGTQRAYNRESP